MNLPDSGRHVTRVNQGLFSTTMEAEKRDPGNEVDRVPAFPGIREILFQALSHDFLRGLQHGMQGEALFTSGWFLTNSENRYLYATIMSSGFLLAKW